MSSLNEDIIVIFSDGGSFNNGAKDPSLPTFGSYGTLITRNGEILEKLSGGQEGWTNNMGELTGVIQGLKTLLEQYELDGDGSPYPVKVVSDSQYVVKGASEWIKNWVKKGWRNSAGKPIENKELWKELLKLINDDRIEVTFEWVRGHTGKDDYFSQMNQMCDDIANEVIELWKKGRMGTGQ